MSNIIELEASYKLDGNYDELLKKINEKGYKFSYNTIEEDTYYTDKEKEFVKNRICLRTRKKNDEKLELTFKPRTDDNTEKYGKKEVNISLKVDDYDDMKFVLKNLGYNEYVSFKKDRTVYSKNINGFEHNIMIDKLGKIGNYIELEILAKTENEKEKLHNALDKFVKEFECEKLEEKKKPYRDLVKEYYDNQIN